MGLKLIWTQPSASVRLCGDIVVSFLELSKRFKRTLAPG